LVLTPTNVRIGSEADNCVLAHITYPAQNLNAPLTRTS
jgi:hypothetical protein